MRKMLALLVFWGMAMWVSGQKEDYVWLLGYINSSHSVNSTAGGCKLDFNYSPVDTVLAIKKADFDACNVSYCDKNGNLMFYSNCADVFDARDSIMENGDTINHGVFWDSHHDRPAHRYNGMPILQGILAISASNEAASYYLFHFALVLRDLPNGFNMYVTDTMFATKIDMNGNSGFGSVAVKNIPVTSDTLYGTGMSAVKHGNGEYWWILKPYYIGNKYYKFLLDETGIHLHDIQQIGGYQNGWAAMGYSCFSPDGEKYFRVNAVDAVWMFDFDRCSGVMSNPVHIAFPFPNDSIALAAGIAVSPNNRFLYVSCTSFVLQYDLWANPIESSVDTVAFVDIFSDPYPTQFFMMQLAPDGKIYINHPNSVKTLHVIDLPDEPGTNCNLYKNGVPLPTLNSFSLPNFPNYRLGAKAGSACDTITGLNEPARAAKEKEIKVFPNPASYSITIDMQLDAPSPIDIQVFTIDGQIVINNRYGKYAGSFNTLIDFSDLPDGIYLFKINTNQDATIKKIIKHK